MYVTLASKLWSPRGLARPGRVSFKGASLSDYSMSRPCSMCAHVCVCVYINDMHVCMPVHI